MSIFTPARRVLYAPSEEAIQVPFVIDRHAGVLPSFATDFAHNAGESEYPELWKGLAGFWPIFLGQTGSKIIDLSGNGNDGTLEGDTHFIPGKFGPTLDFDGTGDRVQIGAAAFFGGMSQLSIVTWVKTTVGSTDSIVAKSYTNNSFELTKRSSEFAEFMTFTSGGDVRATGTSNIVDGTWHQVVGVYDGVNNHIYVDGILEKSEAQTGTINVNTTPLVFGVFHNDGVSYGSYWLGQIDHVLIYFRALSASEIAFLASNPTALVQLRRRAVMVSVGVAVGEDFFRTIEDGVGIVDSMNRIQDLSRTITDGVGTADTIGRTQVQLRTLAETLGLTDTIWKAETRIFADAVGIADTITKAQAFARTIADDIGLIDSELELMTYVRTLAETLGITDVMSKTVGFPRTISDDVGITDSVTRTATFARIVAEAMGIADVVTKTQVQLRTIADAMGLTDVMTRGQVITFAEAMGIADTMSHTKTQIRVIADSLGITDDLTRIATYVFVQSDDVGIGDAMLRVAVALRTISDDVGMTDAMSSSIGGLVKAAWAFMIIRQTHN